MPGILPPSAPSCDRDFRDRRERGAILLSPPNDTATPASARRAAGRTATRVQLGGDHGPTGVPFPPAISLDAVLSSHVAHLCERLDRHLRMHAAPRWMAGGVRCRVHRVHRSITPGCGQALPPRGKPVDSQNCHCPLLESASASQVSHATVTSIANRRNAFHTDLTQVSSSPYAHPPFTCRPPICYNST